jgi:hypothetical protein
METPGGSPPGVFLFAGSDHGPRGEAGAFSGKKLAPDPFRGEHRFSVENATK